MARTRRSRAAGTLARLVAASACLLAAARGHGQEIAPYRLIGVDGYLSTKFLRDEYVTDQPGGTRSRQAQTDMRQELFLMTHSYVYHPNFMLLDVGGGPIMQSGRFDADAGSSRSSGTLYNFATRATFLRDKPYRGAVFYEHLNPTLSVSPGQVMSQQNTRYGFDAALLAPVSPVPLQLEATRSESQGRSAQFVLDDRTDRVSLRGSYTFADLGTTQVRYQAIHQASLSGSPGLPIQATTSNSRELNAESRFTFGRERSYELTNLIILSAQDYALSQGALPARNDLRFTLDLRGRHGAGLQTFASLNHTTTDQGALNSSFDSVAAGVTYVPKPEFSAAMSVRGENARSTQSDSRGYTLDGSARYQRPLTVGTLAASYGIRYANRDQQASAPQTTVTGERITLAGAAFVTLASQRVVPGSVTVRNLTRSQTFVEGFDYAVTVIGLQTRVQRLIGGNILDGQDLLVDYLYDVGGTFGYSQTDQNVGLTWNLASLASVYFRYLDTEPHLTSGSPSFPLNTIRNSLYGARADVPLGFLPDTSIGGGFEHETRRETIAPYRRETWDTYAETVEPLFGRGTIRATARRTRIDYGNSLQNVDLHGVGVRLWGRHPWGIDLSADATREEDTAGALPRSRTSASLKAQWRYRKLTLVADLGHSNESQGASSRRRTLAQILLRRDIGP